MSTVKYFGLGGCGVNLVSKLQGSKVEAEFAYFDTSRANLEAINSEELYLVPGVDGSGSNREANRLTIREHLPQFLLEQSLADFNIIVSSSGGGTGSVTTTELIRAADNNAVFIVILVGESSAQMISNTRETLKELDTAAVDRAHAIPMIFDRVSQNNPRAKVDAFVYAHMISLFELLGREFNELDSEDIRNFLDYTRLPSMSEIFPQLTRLHVAANIQNFDLGDPISQVILARTPQEELTLLDVDYRKAGFGNFQHLDESDRVLNYVIDLDAVGHIFKEFDDMAVERKQKATAKIRRRAPLGS